MRVLLVEDDRVLGRGLCEALVAEGMFVDWVRGGADALSAIADHSHALILLDLGLPGADGFAILKSARQAGLLAPVLVITARDGLDDRVKGLDLGADDYLVKPFELRELLARIRAVVRRHQGAATARLICGEAELDVETHRLSYRGQTEVLPAREFALMRALMERPGRILSRSQIEDRIYAWGEEVESNAVDVLIHSIRRKFEKTLILNVRGAGWMSPGSRL